MAIPDAQLETWSHQGSVTQSRDTYATIKRTLEANGSPYGGKVFTVFLQGSYGNDTNIYAESDVDIVIQLHSCFHYEFEQGVTQEDRALFKPNPATYCFDEFKRDVLAWLREKYPESATPDNKAIKLAANGARRNADVIAATEFRRYYRYKSENDESHHDGICLFDRNNIQIVNYPKMHSDHLTAKHQATNSTQESSSHNQKPQVQAS